MAKKSKKSGNQSKPKQIKLSQEEIDLLLKSLEECNLSVDYKEFFAGIVNSNAWLIQQIKEGKLTISKLRRLFACTSEPNKKAQARKEKANQSHTGSSQKGHGRNHSDEYVGATEIEVKHDELKAGDSCPVEYCEGNLYSTDPGIVLNIEGKPLASAKKYIVEKLRCALCGELFTASVPPEVNLDKKYDDSFVAMLMINKYFMAVPLYRQSTLQSMLGVPLPASTQWGIIDKHVEVLKVVYQALLKDAAAGKGFYLDDTSAKILEVIKERESEGKKAGKCFTTGLISVHDDHRVAIFLTDEKSAGATFAPIWALRDESLPNPYLMMDALSANIPKEIEEGLYTLCYCLVHARRNFYDLGEGYDDLVDIVLDKISLLYDNEKQTKLMDEQMRLSYHQQHSQSIMNDLETHLKKYQSKFEPNSSATKAIDYMLKRWTELSQFLRYAGAPMDNNEMERGLKMVIRNRKSSMFYKTKRGAQIAGFIQSLIYSAAQNDINPYDYLYSVLKHQDQINHQNADQWLPWNYHQLIHCLDPGNARQEEVS